MGGNVAIELALAYPELIERLGLVPHPEGGHFAETWRDVLVNRVGIEQAHQPLSRVPIALARHLGLRPETTRWFQLAAWGLALAGA